MDLYILRHGLAAEPAGAGSKRDSERALTPEGKRKLGQIARAVRCMEITFDLILTSPYTRALQTAEIIADEMDLAKQVECTEHLIPGANPRQLIESLDALRPPPECPLLVGHEPGLSRLISLLTAGDIRLALNLKKGGLARISVERLKYGRCGVLEWLLTPGLMRLMGT